MRNTNLTFCAFSACLVFILPACGGGEEAHSEDDGHDHAAHSEDDGHNHGAEEDDAHSQDDGDEHGGEVKELGSVTVAGATLAVSAGHFEAGAEVDVEVVHSSGDVPAGIRAWVGFESGVGSLKAKAHTHGDDFHALVEVPEELGPDARLWLQVESATGESETQGLAIPNESDD